MLEQLDVEQLSPLTIWKALDDETKRLAGEAMYADGLGRKEADMAISIALRFRETAVKKLPVAQRVKYLLGRVRIDEALATSMLLAIHLRKRSDMLQTFLDTLDVPNDKGMIADRYDLQPPEPEKLKAAVVAMEQAGHPKDHIRLYLASLLALDPDIWDGVRTHLA